MFTQRAAPPRQAHATDSSSRTPSTSTEGIVRCNPANRTLTCTFLIKGKVYMFSGTFTSDLPMLASEAATITYDNIAQLEASHSFTGNVNPTTGMEIKLTNGVVIKGGAGATAGYFPSLGGNVVSGWGTWLLA